MICKDCIHNTVCYEKQEDKQALKFCSDYFNLTKELEKIQDEIAQKIDFEEKWLLDIYEKQHRVGAKDIEIAMSAIRHIVSKLKENK